MSHMVRGKTSFTVENKELLIEALKEAFPGKEVVECSNGATWTFDE